MSNSSASDSQRTEHAPRLRADARRNREQILIAARDIFAEHGPDAPLEDIAGRAGVGIGTLYRRFPDRRALQRAVALDVLARVGHEAYQALTEEPTAFDALVRYMHHALDLRIAVLIPTLMEHVSMEEAEILRARDVVSKPMQDMIAQAQVDGALRADVAFGDIGLLIVRLSRPLPGPIPRDVNDRLAHRHLDLLIDGLRANHGRAVAPLSEPALDLAGLRAMSPESEERESAAPNHPTGSSTDETGER